MAKPGYDFQTSWVPQWDRVWKLLQVTGACCANKLNIADNKRIKYSHVFFRINPNIVNSKSKGIHKALFCGSNTSCRQHLHQHYTVYQQWCHEQGIMENYWAVPPHILKEREDAKKPKRQTKLDEVVVKEKRPVDFLEREFWRLWQS